MPKAGAGDYTDLIDYKEALRSIQPNLEKDEPLQKEWTLIKGKIRNATETFSTVSMSIKTRLSNNHKKETNQQIKLLNNNMPG